MKLDWRSWVKCWSKVEYMEVHNIIFLYFCVCLNFSIIKGLKKNQAKCFQTLFWFDPSYKPGNSQSRHSYVHFTNKEKQFCKSMKLVIIMIISKADNVVVYCNWNYDKSIECNNSYSYIYWAVTMNQALNTLNVFSFIYFIYFIFIQFSQPCG